MLFRSSRRAGSLPRFLDRMMIVINTNWQACNHCSMACLLVPPDDSMLHVCDCILCSIPDRSAEFICMCGRGGDSARCLAEVIDGAALTSWLRLPSIEKAMQWKRGRTRKQVRHAPARKVSRQRQSLRATEEAVLFHGRGLLKARKALCGQPCFCVA